MATKPLVSKVHDQLDKLEMDTRNAIKEKPESGKFLVDEFTKRVDDIAIDGLTDDQKKEYKSAVDKKVKDLRQLAKSLAERKSMSKKNLKESEKLNEGWRGCKKVEMISHGAYSDPELCYRGRGGKKYCANYWDIEDSMWTYYQEEHEYAMSHDDEWAKKLNATYDWSTIEDEDEDEDFNRFVVNNEDSVISDIIDYSSNFDESLKNKKPMKEKTKVNEDYKLEVRYQSKKTGDIYTRKYDYYGETDRTKLKWIQDADKVAFGNCKKDEDVMGYNLIKESKRGNMSNKNLKEGRKPTDSYRGCDYVKVIWNGAYNDPELYYRDDDGEEYYANYWEVDDYMFDAYENEHDYAQKHDDEWAKEMNSKFDWSSLNDTDNDEDFSKFVADQEDRVIGFIIDLNSNLGDDDFDESLKNKNPMKENRGTKTMKKKTVMEAVDEVGKDKNATGQDVPMGTGKAGDMCDCVHAEVDVTFADAVNQDKENREKMGKMWKDMEKDAKDVTPKDPESPMKEKNMFTEKLTLDESLFEAVEEEPKKAFGKNARKKLGESSKRDDIDAKRDNRVERAKARLNKVRDDADAQRDDRLKKRGLKEGNYPGWRHMDASQRHNAKMASIFDRYKKQIDDMAKFLMDHGVSEEEVKELRANTGLNKHDLDDKLIELDLWDDFWKTVKESLMTKTLEESDKPAAISMEDAQKWVDYDMKKYGRISDRTNRLVRKAGFQILKDDHGDYEVAAGKFESLDKAIVKEDWEDDTKVILDITDELKDEVKKQFPDFNGNVFFDDSRAWAVYVNGRDLGLPVAKFGAYRDYLGGGVRGSIKHNGREEDGTVELGQKFADALKRIEAVYDDDTVRLEKCGKKAVKEEVEDKVEEEKLKTPRGDFDIYKGTWKEFKNEPDREDWGLWFEHTTPEDADWDHTEKYYKIFHNGKNNHIIAVLYKDRTVDRNW